MTNNSPRQFMPAPQQHGGSRVGNSYLNEYAGCPRKWFYRYLFPQLDLVDDEGRVAPNAPLLGIAPAYTDPNLLKGSTFHEGLAAWYRSGIHGGEYTHEHNLAVALDTLEAHHRLRLREWQIPEEAEVALSSLRVMMTAYHERYDATGTKPDLTLAVYIDPTGEPWIEREFEIPLGGGYLMTCRVDMVAYYRGRLAVVEHKTSAATSVNSRLDSAYMDPQATTELMAGRAAGLPVEEVVYNVIVKDRSAKSKFDVAERCSVTRTEADFDAFTRQARQTLDQIETSKAMFEAGLFAKDPWHEAADYAFPELGKRNGGCRSYNRRCEFWDLCTNKGHEAGMLRGFRQRTLAEVTESTESPY